MSQRRGSLLFVNKKKTFFNWAVLVTPPQAEVFCAAFFQKSGCLSVPVARRSALAGPLALSTRAKTHLRGGADGSLSVLEFGHLGCGGTQPLIPNSAFRPPRAVTAVPRALSVKVQCMSRRLFLLKIGYVISSYTFRHAISARAKARGRSVAAQLWDPEVREASSGHPLCRPCGAASAQHGPNAVERTVGGCYCLRLRPGPT